MKTYASLFLMLSMALFNLSCSTTSKSSSSNSQEIAPIKAKTSPEVVYFIYEDGEYTEASLDRKVEPLGGDKAFYTTAYSNIKYPPHAREKGVQGTVWITLVVNELGIMEEAVLKQGIGSGCDEEALRCIKMAAKRGFEPPLKDGKPVKVKFDIPTKFSLG